MAFTFPALVPEERSYSAGRFNADRRTDLSGAAVRFLRSRIATGHRLTLTFAEATEAETRAILDHYRQAQSSFLPFGLLEATWCGTDYAIDRQWRYAEAPQVTDVAYDRYSLEVTLLSITVDLPARSVTPIETGTTVAVQAETPPSPPADPTGSFFRSFEPTLEVRINGLLQITTRAFRDPESSIEIRVPSGFGRFPELTHNEATLEITSPNGGLSLPGQVGLDLIVNQNLPPVVLFSPTFSFEESGPTPTFFDNPNPVLNHSVSGSPTVELAIPTALTAGSATPGYFDNPDPSFNHVVFGVTVGLTGAATALQEGAGTPAYVDNPDPLLLHLVLGSPTITLAQPSTIDGATAETPSFTDLTP